MKWRSDWVSEWDYVSKNLKYIKFEKIKKKGYFIKKNFRKKNVFKLVLWALIIFNVSVKYFQKEISRVLLNTKNTQDNSLKISLTF